MRSFPPSIVGHGRSHVCSLRQGHGFQTIFLSVWDLERQDDDSFLEFAPGTSKIDDRARVLYSSRFTAIFGGIAIPQPRGQGEGFLTLTLTLSRSLLREKFPVLEVISP